MLVCLVCFVGSVLIALEGCVRVIRNATGSRYVSAAHISEFLFVPMCLVFFSRSVLIAHVQSVRVTRDDTLRRCVRVDHV